MRNELKMLLVIPMAGRVYFIDKVSFGLLKVAGKPMLHHAFRSVSQLSYRKVVFVALKEHQEFYDLQRIIRGRVVRGLLVLLDDITEGQLCTVSGHSNTFRKVKDCSCIASDSYVVLERLQEDIDRGDYEGLISVIKLPENNGEFC